MESMTKLAPLVDIICNDDDCVLLKVKPDCEVELLEIPGYTGDEKYLRMTKSSNPSYFFKFRDGHILESEYNEFVTESEKDKRRILRDTIVYSFGICCTPCLGGDFTTTNYIKTLEDDLRQVHTYELHGFDKEDMALFKNGCHLGMFSYDSAMEYLNDHFHGKITEPVHTKSPKTECDIYIIKNRVD